MTEENMNLAELLQKGGDGDFFAERGRGRAADSDGDGCRVGMRLGVITPEMFGNAAVALLRYTVRIDDRHASPEAKPGRRPSPSTTRQ